MNAAKPRDCSVSRQVLTRDRGICQCCGYVENPEVHHIQPVIYGGMATPNNLITLCAECHKFAPDKPEHFLAYQKSGGARWQRFAGYLLMQEAEFSPKTTAEEIKKAVTQFRLSTFENNYKERELVSKSPRLSRTAWLKENILALLNQDAEKWLTRAEIFNYLTKLESGESINAGTFSMVLYQMHVDGRIEKSTITKRNPTKTLAIYKALNG
ncbi:hypothetical protein ACX27_27300 [Nostoc piscinale CENA21]|uniref:HNH nuclease domain-containing protein n=1 Tax=Nostoc piscinale CENA21 TaxID=224013 RepID=A0A0M5MI26_9NOSO|nr:HNH endonuclease [Nostoc piscinale]ALF55718.1 hypothetical protein ACX27_27300 [Nostoc piscinale CENA21]